MPPDRRQARESLAFAMTVAATRPTLSSSAVTRVSRPWPGRLWCRSGRPAATGKTRCFSSRPSLEASRNGDYLEVCIKRLIRMSNRNLVAEDALGLLDSQRAMVGEVL